MPVFAMFILLLFGPAVSAATERSVQKDLVRVERVVKGLNVPWSIAFLPQCELLITQRGGELIHVDSDGQKTSVAGVPQVYALGQGGLLDVAVARDFAKSREIFISFAKPQVGGAGTALAVGRLADDGSRLTDVVQIFEMASGSAGGRHFGSRIVEGLDGTIFLTVGDRGNAPAAQFISAHNGSVIRINRDGSVPSDNPHVGKRLLEVFDIKPEIWSSGHRNPQGAALDLHGQLWVSEHGARGGDEINMIRKGRNYGWPTISYGVHYSGGKIGEGFAKEGMEQPEFYWDPSIAPSGLLFYSGKLWNEWRGHLFVGSLNSDLISRIVPDFIMREAERIKFPETKRVRDIREAPDGAIWFLSEDHGSAYRMTPANSVLDSASGCRPRSR